jgi:hypothetical protein
VVNPLYLAALCGSERQPTRGRSVQGMTGLAGPCVALCLPGSDRLKVEALGRLGRVSRPFQAASSSFWRYPVRPPSMRVQVQTERVKGLDNNDVDR